MFGLLYWIFVVNLPIKQWQFPNSIPKECWSFNVAVAFFGKCLALNPNFRNSIKSSSGQESQWQILHKFYWGDGAKEGTARKSGITWTNEKPVRGHVTAWVIQSVGVTLFGNLQSLSSAFLCQSQHAVLNIFPKMQKQFIWLE